MGMVATTVVSQTAVHARFADRSDSTAATQWFEFEVPLADLGLLTGSDRSGMPVEARFLSQAKLAALRYLHALIGAEIERLSAPPVQEH